MMCIFTGVSAVLCRNLPARYLRAVLAMLVGKAELNNQIGRIFWTQRNRLQPVEYFAISLEIVGALKVGRPYQSLNEHYAGGWIWQLEDIEVALDGGMKASVVGENLHDDVRQGGHLEDLGQLSGHD